MGFEFSTAAEIVFGEGVLARSGSLAARWGRRALVVTGRNVHRAEGLRERLRAAGVESAVFACEGEPSTGAVVEAVEQGRQFGANLVIGYGGGSAIDAAKAVAGLATNPGGVMDYLEVVGAGRTLSRPALPWIAIPTTAGTGAEVTRNAVLTVADRRLKVSLRSPLLLAKVAIVDPELTVGLPREVAAATGLDALTQLIEAYVCLRANPMTDALCESGIRRAARALPALARDDVPIAARTDLCWASLASGMALANAGLGAVHGLASPIGGRFAVAHGPICAALLAPIMETNLAALRARVPGGPALARYREVAGWLTRRDDAEPDDGVACVRDLVRRLGLPQLGALGVAVSEAPALATAAQNASSMKANPVTLTIDELVAAIGSAC